MRFVVMALAGASAEYLSDSEVFTSMISQYFTPTLYNELGYAEFISLTESLYDIRDQMLTVDLMTVSQDAITYYNFAALDTSQISAFSFGTQLADYKMDQQQQNSFNNRDNKQALFISEMV
jgi:hypothetical protein